MKTQDLDLKNIISSALQKAIDYKLYRERLERKVANYIPSPTGIKPDFEYYSKLNHQRMKRIEKGIKLQPEIINQIKGIKKKYIWLIITEDWCGDAAQSLPYLNALAELNVNIQLKIIYRDQNVDLMKQFLTEGSKSIPKLIIFNQADLHVEAQWGPRPKGAQQLRKDLQEKNEIMSEVAIQLQKWYAADKGSSIIKEVLHKLDLIPVHDN